MRIASYIIFMDKDKVSQKAFELIGKSKEYDLSDILQAIEIYTDLNDYNLFLEELAKHNIEYEERFRTVFSNKELSNAEYLYITSSDYCFYPQPENSYREECFNFNTACPKCNNGAEQKNPFKIKGNFPKGKNREILNLNWEFEFLISDRIASSFKKEKYSGYTTWPLIDDVSGKEISGWKQLFIENTLPPMSQKTVFPIIAEENKSVDPNEYGIKNPSLCSCGKMGKNLPDAFYYRRKDLNKFLDFNKTNEWLGGGYTTYQHKIISNRVFKLLKQEKVKNLEFKPIIVVEE